MLNSDKLCIEKIVNQTRSSERKFKEGDFKGAIEDKRELRCLLKSKFCDEDIFKQFKEELSFLYASKFDLINDHKLRIDESKINEIVKLLEQKGDEKYNNGAFKGAIRALRRSEKYLAKKIVSVWFFYKFRFDINSYLLLLNYGYASIYFGKFVIFFSAIFISFLSSKN